ncbi:hypothetical protein EVAR_46999_1 [Eumeta japonica]|uniref:Uncharacterized protein n=1 Tax=Eumeta variegata TaxID=151549 RepID=A0A4C1X5B3_EUMVA|nr:hypothetical protein EVAR_46999_1 [Eumeta japonica]
MCLGRVGERMSYKTHRKGHNRLRVDSTTRKGTFPTIVLLSAHPFVIPAASSRPEPSRDVTSESIPLSILLTPFLVLIRFSYKPESALGSIPVRSADYEPFAHTQCGLWLITAVLTDTVIRSHNDGLTLEAQNE